MTKPIIEEFNLNGTNLETLSDEIKQNGWKDHEVPRPGVLNSIFKLIIIAVDFLLKNSITSDTDGATGSEKVDNIIVISKAQYDAIHTKNVDTIYMLT